VLGPVFGAIFIVFVPEGLKMLLSYVSGGDVLAQRYLGPTREIVFGFLIIGFLIFESRGLAAICARIWSTLRRLAFRG
ncbi:MAG: branched-chain amino acid ABC transporter permease, partial [Alphaproteobacteria bacterium]|nr:branched-chain amino acid ABC transporter permease [Alphaproteobacteria bacterium]